MIKSIAGCFMGVLVFLGTVGLAFADAKSYVWTYEYQTLSKGMAEVEYWLTAQVPDSKESNVNTWQHWLELEYGITDHWDVSLYQMLKHNNTASSVTSEYDGFKIETRYRLGERGKFFVDPLLYLEYKRDADVSIPNVGEAKLILAKDIGNFNISYNQIIERNLESKGRPEHEYALGAGYAFFPSVRGSVELKGSYTEHESALGPSLSWVNSKFWVTLGAVFGLNKKTDDVQARMIVGVSF